MKRISTLILALALLLALASPALAYSFEVIDISQVVGPSDWAKEEVDLARTAGLITAHTGLNLRSDITRFQFAELAVNLAEKVTGKAVEAAPAGTFLDSDEIAVRKAFAAGIVNGMGDGTFAPETATNREQIATMISRAIAYIEAETGKRFAPATLDLTRFTDRGEVSSWALDGVGLLAANGIMNGTSATTLSPKNPCTIEQSILLIYRLYVKTQA